MAEPYLSALSERLANAATIAGKRPKETQQRVDAASQAISTDLPGSGWRVQAFDVRTLCPHRVVSSVGPISVGELDLLPAARELLAKIQTSPLHSSSWQDIDSSGSKTEHGQNKQHQSRAA
jgi:hypothetical protein